MTRSTAAWFPLFAAVRMSPAFASSIASEVSTVSHSERSRLSVVVLSSSSEAAPKRAIAPAVASSSFRSPVVAYAICVARISTAARSARAAAR